MAGNVGHRFARLTGNGMIQFALSHERVGSF